MFNLNLSVMKKLLYAFVLLFVLFSHVACTPNALNDGGTDASQATVIGEESSDDDEDEDD
ncbi:MAG: hypothetical protein KDC90_00050 [Ignavibacteriae bacterium]|nr:hypothetical protein [Ignavibacteriota bacterium]